MVTKVRTFQRRAVARFNPPRRITFVTLLTLLVCIAPIATSRAATRELDRSRQCVVVLTNDWASITGVLDAFERRETSASWKKQGSEFVVVVGKNGLGQGRGLIRLDFKGAPQKEEGDDRAPAGIFRLSSAFGYAPARSAAWVKLPHLALSRQTEGIDDRHSHYYNKLVDRSKVGQIDWHSSERMRRDDILYKWGVMVDHNPAAIPGAGSCIFLHIWKNSSAPTAGCTAMPESDLVRLLRWLDPARHPILVQMPRAVYQSIRSKYGLSPDDY
jgi:L,D-peptidoglycan transpeptidase YkuD (ErfK/YbiS/YcfS/YnhG family)